MRVQQLIEDDLNKRSVKHASKSTLVARGADTQLEFSCVAHVFGLCCVQAQIRSIIPCNKVV